MSQVTVDGGSGKPSMGKLGWIWFWGLWFLFLLSWALDRLFNDVTELTPFHDDISQACLYAGGAAAVVSAGIAIAQSKKFGMLRRVGAAIVFAFIGSLSIFFISNSIAEVIENRLDFPAGKTQTHKALMAISRAYHSPPARFSGDWWNIQTMPIWSNMRITRDDYRFMLTHRRPGDDGRNPDEISSKGYFCAHLIVETVGDAMRVLHAGSHELPNGTVIVCPSNPPT